MSRCSLPRETTSEPSKAFQACGALYILTSERASRHNGVHFSNISTSKRVPRLTCLYILTSKCASRHNGVHFLNISTSRSAPNPSVFNTFDFQNVLLATTACTFSTSQLPKVVRTWCALYMLTCKCASRRNGVQFFISHLASWLRTRRFSEPTFRPPEPQTIEKTQ